MKYIHTHREEYVMSFYKKLNIQQPREIIPSDIAQALHIYIKYHDKPSNFQCVGRYKAIMLQQGLPREEERLHFFHELGHLLRHAGSQLFMPNEFTELQEWDANHFQFYAAMPWHMMRQFDFQSITIVEELSDAFQVPPSFAERKLAFVLHKAQEYQAHLNDTYDYKNTHHLKEQFITDKQAYYED
ncbi:ImmA/IrrE family metallo-endopeptidase [Salipaludibacillus agaradhaerens]|uniref:ImmA/IrrE family metallo-endopeptidase n=1 Tax=Salipaludibacillus agaradhaerens TaxID=76935 RepID=UPI002150CB44|nr:ImmA/IrrE family metallo-endopeptidase [Salipaludibacillus agaradhaerens]MCR6106246.1 ImmA/IrrE family metallo-endopeptidase [Salipaludibacillus agaradhaerens]MCR6118279.1 ImmA/IrrE family metallo-endopeptidase [Salipaludibacillus agaradhaerens]UJW57388.1 ImmA/IrrE family metallo-endopeptidase [Bacillus sp. A116_S68]